MRTAHFVFVSKRNISAEGIGPITLADSAVFTQNYFGKTYIISVYIYISTPLGYKDTRNQGGNTAIPKPANILQRAQIVRFHSEILAS